MLYRFFKIGAVGGELSLVGVLLGRDAEAVELDGGRNLAAEMD